MSCQLSSRLHSELPKNLVEVVFDRAGADEHVCRDLGVGAALCDEFGDSGLLGGKVRLEAERLRLIFSPVARSSIRARSA